ncbi:MAG TPA: hypothetical protein VFE46_03825 [Pirellulales bacterium]|jgi:hypothetical protein|nr:hypothetical protein [Pirellulales bacterium]
MAYGEPQDFENDEEAHDDAQEYFDDDEPTMECPYCGAEILETTPRCPHCERYISEEDSPARKKSWLVILGTGLCLYIVYRWIAG